VEFSRGDLQGLKPALAFEFFGPAEAVPLLQSGLVMSWETMPNFA
jgi:hypothetical protein